MCRYLTTSYFVVIELYLNSTRIESSQFILNGSWSNFALNRQQEKVLRERNQALQVSTFYLPFGSRHTLLQEEQARQAKQIQVLESERVAQELLLLEKGAQIKVIKNFPSFCRKRKQCKSRWSGTFYCVSEKKPRCWRMRTWLLQPCLETSRNNFHRFYKVKTRIKLVSGKAFCQKQSEHWNTSITGRQQTSINCHQLCHLVYCLCEGTRKVCSHTTKPHNFYLGFTPPYPR